MSIDFSYSAAILRLLVLASNIAPSIQVISTHQQAVVDALSDFLL